jgi:hypothetical protein
MARMGESEMHIGFGWGNLQEKDYLEDHGVGGSKTYEQLQKTGWDRADWIYLA